eukprot:CAMPEP_0175061152 /NCGR_PEP_ID=MMETSP0052_2-20121109/13429_1 /TAXON_ID=51329 ORGANISM="Polytomella parva, Strain SAG 63-3" /NCGR_SAMPLE_ID=MMETSP0052_2 /ASSEMBLY_ACC=CAM_ASM_000194 /LENGTH=333 /DNA_ID=CAMNT_0016326981 /DNA_START=36 /DNA_END=1033 /DNA_ORIENTATION=+
MSWFGAFTRPQYTKLGSQDKKEDEDLQAPDTYVSSSNASRSLKTRNEADASFPIATLTIEGMTCASCSRAVEDGLSSVPGVKRTSVALLQGRAEVVFDANLLDPKTLPAAVDDIGFDAVLLNVHYPVSSRSSLSNKSVDDHVINIPSSSSSYTTVTSSIKLGTNEQALLRLKVSGMVCASCSSAVEKFILAVPSVISASVSLATGEAEVIYYSNSNNSDISHHPNVVDLKASDDGMAQTLISALDEAGFDAQVLSGNGLDCLFLKVTGLCDTSACVIVESALRNSPGVSRVTLSLAAPAKRNRIRFPFFGSASHVAPKSKDGKRSGAYVELPV